MQLVATRAVPFPQTACLAHVYQTYVCRMLLSSNSAPTSTVDTSELHALCVVDLQVCRRRWSKVTALSNDHCILCSNFATMDDGDMIAISQPYTVSLLILHYCSPDLSLSHPHATTWFSRWYINISVIFPSIFLFWVMITTLLLICASFFLFNS